MRTVLIVDDDPQHLRLYTWIIERAGFRAVTALVGNKSVEMPEQASVDAIALDHRLSSELSSVDVARLLKNTFPAAPIILLSEVAWMPKEMTPYAAAFVNKGEPQELLTALEAATRAEPRSRAADTSG